VTDLLAGLGPGFPVAAQLGPISRLAVRALRN
jgi:hypothetical protein